MARTDQNQTDQAQVQDESKAAQERREFFYANHRPPEGYAARVVRGRLEIVPIKDAK